MSWLKQAMCIAALLCGATAFAGQGDFTQELSSYVGQKLILRTYGDLQKVTVKRKNLNQPAGTCDRAVEVLNAAQKKDKIIFRLEQIGSIDVGGASHCSQVWSETEFIITDLGDISLRDFNLMLQDVFLTPEAYLGRNGRSFNLQPSEVIGPVAFPGINATLAKPILQVGPVLTEEARQARIGKSYIRLSAVVGTDGRIHSPQITSNPGYGLDKQSLRVLSLWRFDPARQGDKSVSVQMQLEFTFAVY